ncbi:MAG TPA: alginate export family protein [Bacteroidales bacterium]|nr:alginate export family protein [Bacteroidales bacterium]
MKKFYMQLILPVLLLAATPGIVNAQFNLSSELRMRGEYRDGYSTLRDSTKYPYLDMLGRARAIFDYKSEKFSTRINLQGAWVFGQNSFSSDTITKNTINLYEAWLRYAFTNSFALKVGRCELKYDDQRFIGVSDWTMWGASHDVLMAQWEVAGAGYKGDFGLAINNMAPASSFLSSYIVKGNYKYLGYLWDQKKFANDKVTLSLLAVVDAFQKASTSVTKSKTTFDTLNVYNENDSIIGTTVVPTTTKTTTTTDYPTQLYARATVGLDAWLNLKKFRAFASGYYQGGHYKDGHTLNAWFYSVWLEYQPVQLFTIKAGFDHIGGNDFSDTTGQKTKYTGFSTLYGSAHGFYGYMDLWSTYVRDNIYAGLNDLYARATLSFTEKMKLELTWRWFSLPYSYLNVADKANKTPYTQVSKSLGNEFDLMYVYSPFKNFDLNAAYCLILPTHTMELQRGLAVGTSKFAQYVYVQVTYKPNFYSSEKK